MGRKEKRTQTGKKHTNKEEQTWKTRQWTQTAQETQKQETRTDTKTSNHSWHSQGYVSTRTSFDIAGPVGLRCFWASFCWKSFIWLSEISSQVIPYQFFVKYVRKLKSLIGPGKKNSNNNHANGHRNGARFSSVRTQKDNILKKQMCKPLQWHEGTLQQKWVSVQNATGNPRRYG